MNILSQNYNNLLKNMIIDIFTTNLKEQLNSLSSNNSVFNYVALLSNLDESLSSIARESLINIFESIDKAFSSSFERKRKYDIKSHHKRTILTVFGQITFTRTFYKSKLNNKLFCFVDRYLGLHKYDYFDPYLKALVVEHSSNNSMPKTANFINSLIGNRISIKDKVKFLSRQSIRNIILKAELSNITNEYIDDTPDVIHIIADEKWIHTQNNNKKDVMEKSIVLFEDIKNHKLHNKQIFASLDYSFLDNCLDYIYNTYDIDKIKTIYCLGDGASWIKSLEQHFHFNSNIKVIGALDKFHFTQAIHHICLDKSLEYIMISYIINNKKKWFTQLCDYLIDSHSNRSDTIENKKQYILNNWSNIINLYKYNLSCPMESQISHNLADLFTSRPKAYSIKMINKLTKIRLLFKNNYNIKELYLNNFNSNITLTINQNQLNFDMFERKHSNFNPLKLFNEPVYPIPYDNSYHPARRF